MPPERHIPEAPIKIRQRSQRACDPCRKRKIKCDGAEPCGHCAGYGYDCVYTQRRTSQKDKSTVDVASSVRSTQATWRPSASITGASPARSAASSIGLPNVSHSKPTAVAEAPERKDDGPYVATETFVQESQSDGGPLLFYNLKTRFTSAYSAVAWPKSLGISLGLSNPPRLQAFGWNPGRRPEVKRMPQNNICNIITLDEVKYFADVYFREVHPFFGFISKEMFAIRSTEFWVSQKQGTDFEAVICGVIALGSYFSGSESCAAEAQVVEQGKVLLDLSIAYSPGLLSVKHVQAWILRALYLRSTTRPHLSWMASCNAVHIAEALGLHRDIGVSQMTHDMPHLFVKPAEEELRRRTFWVAVSLNQFFAAEYGRTRIQLDLIECPCVASEGGDLTSQTIAFLLAIPSPRKLSETTELLTALNKIWSLPVEAPFLGLLRADAAFCVFRMLHSSSLSLPEANIHHLLDIIRCATDAASFLNTQQTPWWNIIGTQFHSVLVLLSIGTAESFAMIPLALKILKSTVVMYNSHLSNEALRTAQELVQGARDKIGKDLETLDQGLNIVGDLAQNSTGNTLPEMNDFEWQMDIDLGLSEFLNLGNFMDLTPDGLLPSRFEP